MKTLLIMTVGQSDVQIVINDQRHKFDGNSCGTLHDAIKAREWSVVDAPHDRNRDFFKAFLVGTRDQAAPEFLGFEGKPEVVPIESEDVSGGKSTWKWERRCPIEGLPDGEVKLCTPKLDAVLAHIGSTMPTSALILETNRQHRGDPRLSGEVVERRLRDRGVDQVIRVAFLIGEELLEDTKSDVDAVVRQIVVAKLSDAIKNQIEHFTKRDQVYVATTGGLAAANELINELVRLYAVSGPIVNAIEVPDPERSELTDLAVEERFHPASGFRARWHALSLIEKGNLLGAWGAVSHLESAPGQEWTQVVKWLAHFASSLPLPEGCDLNVLSHARMAVKAAIRVELALRAEDIPRAVHGTVAFFEAALWDKLVERIERCRDENKRRFYRFKSGVAPTEVKLLRKGDRCNEDRKCPFEWKETVEGVDWYWVHDGDGGPAARLAKYYLQSNALTEFDKTLGINRLTPEEEAQATATLTKGNKVQGRSIRDLRNDVAHNEPTPQLMNEARYRMQAAKLWSSDDTFLSQPLVKDVLVELGVKEPDRICDDLISTVRERLRTVEVMQAGNGKRD